MANIYIGLHNGVLKLIRINKSVWANLSYSEMFISFLSAILICSFGLLVLIRSMSESYSPVELLGCAAYLGGIDIKARIFVVFWETVLVLCVFNVFGFALYYSKMYQYNLKRILTYASALPLGYLFAQQALVGGSIDVNSDVLFFWLSVYSYIVTLSLVLTVRILQNHQIDKSHAVPFLLSLALSFFVYPAILCGAKPLLFYWFNQSLATVLVDLNNIFFAKLWIPPVFVLLVGLIFPRRQIIVRYLLAPLQLIILLGLCTILPTPYTIDGTIVEIYPIGRVFFILLLPLIGVGVYDILRRIKREDAEGSFLSPFVGLSFLFFIFFLHPIGTNFMDCGYELGSRYPAFVESYLGRAKLFKDVHIAYGLFDYFRFYAGFFFGGVHAPSMGDLGSFVEKVILLSCNFFAIYSLVPLAPTVLICLIAIADFSTIVCVFFCILFNRKLLENPSRWIAVFLLLSFAYPFLRIPQGFLCVVSALPMCIYQLFVLKKINKSLFGNRTIVLMLSLVIVYLVLFQGYISGLLQFFYENAQINADLFGNMWTSLTVPVVRFVLGNSLVFVPIVSFVCAIVLNKSKSTTCTKKVSFFLFSSMSLFAILSLNYGFSRTDGAINARQGAVALALFSVLLTVFWAYCKDLKANLSCVVLIFVLVALFPGRFFVSPKEAVGVISDVPKILNFSDASSFDLPQLGAASFKPGYLNQKKEVKNVLDKILKSNETFLNLSIDGMYYFSSNRRQVIEQSSYYNYPGDKAQLRAVSKLKANNIDVGLIGSNYIDAPLPLRAYYLYRYIVTRGIPMRLPSAQHDSELLAIVMPREYFLHNNIRMPESKEIFDTYMQLFPFHDLGYLPYIWGKSDNSMLKKLGSTIKLHEVQHSIDSSGDEFYEFRAERELGGQEFGLFLFDYIPGGPSSKRFNIEWKADDDIVGSFDFQGTKGSYIVPLDSSPRWLLASKIKSLKLKLTNTVNFQEVWKTSQSAAYELNPESSTNIAIKSPGCFIATNDDPTFNFAIPDRFKNTLSVVRIIVDTPASSLAQFFYKSRSEPFYTEEKSSRINLQPGINELYFVIKPEWSSGEFRFDPVAITSEFCIRSIGIKSLDKHMIEQNGIIDPRLSQRPEIK